MFLKKVIIFISIIHLGSQSNASSSCRSSIKYCANLSVNISDMLTSTTALASAAGCFSVVEALRVQCNILAPVKSVFFINGKMQEMSFIAHDSSATSAATQSAAPSPPPPTPPNPVVKTCVVNTKCTANKFWCSNGDIVSGNSCGSRGADCFCSGGKWTAY